MILQQGSGLRIAILTNSVSQNVLELVSSGKKRRHVIDPVSLHSIQLSEDIRKDPTVASLASYDVVHHRIASGYVIADLIDRILAHLDIPYLNSADPYKIQKRFQIAMVSEAGITAPKTYAIDPDIVSYDEMQDALGAPFVVKASSGRQGKDVMLVHSEEEFRSAARKIQWMLCQEFIPNEGDFRVLTLGGKAVAGYRRVPREGDFRVNTAQGGSMEPIGSQDITARLFDIAERAVRAIDLDIAGIDIIQSTDDGELYFIESNQNPFMSSKVFYELTGVDLNETMLDFYESFADQWHRK